MPTPQETEQATFNSFQRWYKGLGSAYRMLIGVGGFGAPADPNNINEYKKSEAYAHWVKAGGGSGVTEETEAKAAAYQARLEAQKNAAVEAPPADQFDFGKPAVRWDIVEKLGRIWKVSYDEDGKEVAWEDSGPVQEKGYGAETLDLQRQQLAEQIRQFDIERLQDKEANGTITPYEQSQLDLSRAQLAEQQRQFGLTQTFQQQQLAQDKAQQEEMINWYRQQQQSQLEADRQQRLATLRAQPASWLEYASLSGQTPTVQPWMVPLAPQEYGMKAGQPLPGWTPQSSGQGLGSLPQLLNPSAQYMARIPPSAIQQFGGYEQARTGARPEDVNWRLWNMAPPGGAGSAGLRYSR